MEVQRPAYHQRKVTEVSGESEIRVTKNGLPKFWLEKFEDRKLKPTEGKKLIQRHTVIEQRFIVHLRGLPWGSSG